MPLRYSCASQPFLLIIMKLSLWPKRLANIGSPEALFRSERDIGDRSQIYMGYHLMYVQGIYSLLRNLRVCPSRELCAQGAVSLLPLWLTAPPLACSASNTQPTTRSLAPAFAGREAPVHLSCHLAYCHGWSPPLSAAGFTA